MKVTLDLGGFLELFPPEKNVEQHRVVSSIQGAPRPEWNRTSLFDLTDIRSPVLHANSYLQREMPSFRGLAV